MEQAELNTQLYQPGPHFSCGGEMIGPGPLAKGRSLHDRPLVTFSGADGRTRTGTAFATAPSRQRVYQFHHIGVLVSWCPVPQISTLFRCVFSRLAALRLLAIAVLLLVVAPCQTRKPASEIAYLFTGQDTSLADPAELPRRQGFRAPPARADPSPPVEVRRHRPVAEGRPPGSCRFPAQLPRFPPGFQQPARSR